MINKHMMMLNIGTTHFFPCLGFFLSAKEDSSCSFFNRRYSPDFFCSRSFLDPILLIRRVKSAASPRYVVFTDFKKRFMPAIRVFGELQVAPIEEPSELKNTILSAS